MSQLTTCPRCGTALPKPAQMKYETSVENPKTGKIHHVARNHYVECPKCGPKIYQRFGHHLGPMEKAFKTEFSKSDRATVRAALNTKQREYFDQVFNGKQRPTKSALDHWRSIVKAVRAADTEAR